MGFFDLFKKKKQAAPSAYINNKPEKLSDEQSEKIVNMVNETSKKSAYKLTLDEKRTPGLFDTKFGGTPYWDMTMEYPVSSKGEKLLLLAQINLSDVKDCSYLPSSGMLQFFIGTDDLYGMDPNSYISNDPYRVIYHKTIDENVSEADVLSLDIPTSVNQAETDDFLFPIIGEIAVNVEKREVSVGTADFMYERYFHNAAESLGLKLPENESAFCMLPDDAFDASSDNNTGHWLFGYAYFTQSDPRDYMVDLQDYILLFQMDSEYAKEKKIEILWGDVGVGNFFIKPDDLEKLDFSKVMYTWDCC